MAYPRNWQYSPNIGLCWRNFYIQPGVYIPLQIGPRTIVSFSPHFATNALADVCTAPAKILDPWHPWQLPWFYLWKTFEGQNDSRVSQWQRWKQMNIFYLWRLWLSSKPANISFFTYEHLSNYQANLLFGLSSCPELSNVLCCNRDFGNYQVYVNQTLQQVITKVVATRTNKGIPYTQNRTLYAAHMWIYQTEANSKYALFSNEIQHPNAPF